MFCHLAMDQRKLACSREELNHVFNHSVKGKREGRRRELMFHQNARAKQKIDYTETSRQWLRMI